MSNNPDTSSGYIGFINSFSGFYNPLNTKMILMNPDPVKNNYEDYTGLTSVSSDIMRNCRVTHDSISITLDDPIPIPTIPGKPARTVRKQTISDNYSFSVGWNPFSMSYSDGNSELKSDYFDVNGDRYPDIVGPQYTQLTTPQGGLSDQIINHHQAIGARSNYSEYQSYSAAYGTTFMSASKTSSNSPRNAKFTTSRQGSTSFSAGYNEDQTKYSWQDVNGDGLPDKVNNSGDVCLNIGYNFLPVEHYGFSTIRTGSSYNVGFNGGTSYSLCNSSFSGGLGLGTSTNKTKEVLLDVNGDGLADRIVQNGSDIDFFINYGRGFASAPIDISNTDISKGVSFNRSINIGMTFGFVIPLPFISIKVCINPSANHGTSFNNEQVQISDMNGDGYPDMVTSYNEQTLTVRYSKIGRTNLLKSVDNYLGGSFVIDYHLSQNSVDIPQRIWTMSSLKVYDGFAVDGPEYSYYTFEYDSGYYSRFERQSFGFKSVSTHQYNSISVGDVYRSSIEKYHNTNNTFKNLKYSELSEDSQHLKFIKSTYTYKLKEIATGMVIPASNPDCYGAGYPALDQEDKYFYEGMSTCGIHTRKRYDHGPNGNVKVYYDDGDTSTSFDDIYANVYYHPDPFNKHIISTPDSIIVKYLSAVFRQRSSSIDYLTGAITRVSLYNDTIASTYDLSYDTYGNLVQLLCPSNNNEERMSYRYVYDPTVMTYVHKIYDTLGYNSQMWYDPRFGKLLNSTDITGQTIYYSLDNRGRIDSIQGPYEYLNDKPYTIRFEYWDKYGAKNNPLRMDTVLWARTLHFDPSNDTNDIKTVLFADASGKILQTKKDVAIFNQNTYRDDEKMVASGRVLFDAQGRTVTSYFPVAESLGQDSLFNFTYDKTDSTYSAYDILDRQTLLIKPGNLATTMIYGFGEDYFGELRFKTSTTDPKGITTEVYKDPNEKTTSMHAPYQTWTALLYDPLGQLIKSIDPDSVITQYKYDHLGRKTMRIHPDAGTTSYDFDPAGNLSQVQTQNMAGTGDHIQYHYYFNHLLGINYPDHTEMNVNYEYGSANSGNQTGRIVKQGDMNGVQRYTYDVLGNVLTTAKTLIVPYDTIYTFMTITAYDTWNRIDSIVYPDGETVRYHYNEAGLLREMDGSKNGNNYQYINRIGYDKFESRVMMDYANQSRIRYIYDDHRRHLSHLYGINSSNQNIMDNTYTYDPVGNILSITNIAGPDSNNAGGSMANTYVYDSLYRLDSSNGSSELFADIYDYNLKMNYSLSGKILHKKQYASVNSNPIAGLTRDVDYIYGGVKPHAASLIGAETLNYDGNGNLLTSTDTFSGTYRIHHWDDENRLRLISGKADVAYYLYDATGERTQKLLADYQQMQINDSTTVEGYISNSQTLYVNPYLVVNNQEYTKHYYIENQRIISKLGGGFTIDSVPLFSLVYGFDLNSLNAYNEKKLDLETMIGNDLDSCDLPTAFIIDNGLFDFLSQQEERQDDESEIYYYHPDHLGSTSYITNVNGMTSQHIDYTPFGEVLLEETMGGWLTPYKFNAKEMDGESGLYYYGVRYYSGKWGMWLGVDPMSDKFPNISPFVYCHNNPIILIDPDGMEDVEQEGTNQNTKKQQEPKNTGRTQWLPSGMQPKQDEFKVPQNPNPPNDAEPLSPPVDTKYSITSQYQETNRTIPELGISRPHKAIDIGTPYGTPIQSPGSGVIIKANNTKYGLSMIIKHDYKFKNQSVQTGYAHLSKMNVSQGMRVDKGNIIGNTGSWGTGPHLHFTLRIGGDKVNPTKMFPYK